MKRISLAIILFFTAFSTTKALNITVSTDKPAYLRYETVGINCLMKGSVASPVAYRCTAQVYFKNKLMKTVGDTFQLILAYNSKTSSWEGRWPIPWDPVLGDYKTVVTLKRGNTKAVASTLFKIAGIAAAPLPKGFCVMDIEPGDSIIRRVPGMGGKTVKVWENYVLWAKFMGASAMWHCVGQTQVWNSLDPDTFPWDKQSISQIDDIGAECHNYGIKYGAWISSYVLLGNKRDLAPYALTTGYDEKSDSLKSMIFISLKDSNRMNDLTNLIRALNNNPNVDYIGLDYMRTDFGGYEFVNDFVDEMPVYNIPPDWETLSTEARMLWLGRKIQSEKNSRLVEQWEWWRGHKMAQILKTLLENAGVTKPVWVFNLTWKEGKQHGQDPLMFIDAGASMNAGMFYSIDHAQYPYLINEWRDYLSINNTSLVAGQCVDWNLLGNTYDPPGPQEHYWRQEVLVNELLPVNPSLGLFWHDLTRAFTGAVKGPYSELEWAIAGASAFTYLREKQGFFPFRVKWDLPDRVTEGEIFTVEIVVANDSKNPMDYYLKLINPSDIEMFGNVVNRINLLPGEEKTVNFQIKLNKTEPEKQNRTMIAFMMQYNGNQTQQRYFNFKYLKVEGASSVKHESADNVTKTAIPVTTRSN